MRASIQANGTPNSTASDVAHSEQHSDRRSAWSELSEVRIDQASPHGAFHNRPRKGRAKNPMAMTARTSTGTGSRSWPTRRRRAPTGDAGAATVTAYRSRTRP